MLNMTHLSFICQEIILTEKILILIEAALSVAIKGKNIVICPQGTLKAKAINLMTKRFTFFVLYEALYRIV
jgi:hypothetical protein